MVQRNTSDESWEQFGKSDPYFGVLTHDLFRKENFSESALDEFFKTGAEHVKHVFNTLKLFTPRESLVFNKILDFGCGTGRLVVPFSKYCTKVIGIDVSGAMLEEAQKNIQRFGITNAEFIHANSVAIAGKGNFDLVHSYIVLQHIPVRAGFKIFSDLIDQIKEGGYGVIHFTYANDYNAVKNKIKEWKSNYLWFNKFINILKGKNPNAPWMQMNSYSLKMIFDILRQKGSSKFFTELTNHAGCFGCCLYFQK